MYKNTSPRCTLQPFIQFWQFFGFCSEIKFYSLCQWKLMGKVDGIGLPAHIRFPGIAAAFPAATGFFFTAKSTTDLRAAGANIYIGNAAIAAFCDRNYSASRIFRVMMAEESPWGTLF